jgi:hypothetical protein
MMIALMASDCNGNGDGDGASAVMLGLMAFAMIMVIAMTMVIAVVSVMAMSMMMALMALAIAMVMVIAMVYVKTMVLTMALIAMVLMLEIMLVMAFRCNTVSSTWNAATLWIPPRRRRKANAGRIETTAADVHQSSPKATSGPEKRRFASSRAYVQCYFLGRMHGRQQLHAWSWCFQQDLLQSGCFWVTIEPRPLQARACGQNRCVCLRVCVCTFHEIKTHPP